MIPDLVLSLFRKRKLPGSSRFVSLNAADQISKQQSTIRKLNYLSISYLFLQRCDINLVFNCSCQNKNQVIIDRASTTNTSGLVTSMVVKCKRMVTTDLGKIGAPSHYQVSYKYLLEKMKEFPRTYLFSIDVSCVIPLSEQLTE